MKILYLCPDLGIPVLGSKGASVHVRAMVNALRRAGHTVAVAAPVLSKSAWEEPVRLDSPVLHVPARPEMEPALEALREFSEALGGCASSLPGELRRILYNREFGKQLRRRFRADPPDVIYERASLHATAGVKLAEVLERPLLVELNAPLALEQSTYRAGALGELAAEAERWLLTRADAVLTVSRALRAYVLGLGVAPSRVHLVPNGIDPELFHPGPADPLARQRWRLGSGPVLGFVGGLRPWHGVEILPALLERLVPRHPSVKLVFVGQGPLLADLQCELRARGLGSAAIFTGPLPQAQVADLIRVFALALAPYPRLPHTFYFSPLKLFEYLACGAPVVAAELGQIAEVVRDGETGLLYPPGDLEGLVAACDRLLTDPGLRRRLGAAGAAEVRADYTWERNAQRVAEIANLLQPTLEVTE